MASIYDTHKPAAGDGGGGLYLKIQDGETVKLRIASEPAIFESESRPDDQRNVRLSTRYGWVVWNQDSKQAQILQQSATFFKNIAALAQDDEWGDPTGYDIKITRQGTGLETTYNVTPSANREPLDSEAREQVARVNLLEKLEASPFSQRVMWLSDFDRLAARQSAAPAVSAESKALTAKPAPKKDTVHTNFDDEPINLDDIPF